MYRLVETKPLLLLNELGRTKQPRVFSREAPQWPLAGVCTLTDLLEELVERIANRVAAKLTAPTVPSSEANLVSSMEAGARLGVHPDTMRRWHLRGCPAVNIGKGRLRFDLAEVKAWRAARDGAS